jgi:transglutaminase-like putative cysteine protease
MAYLPVWLMLVLLVCTAWRLRVLRGHWESPSWIFKGMVMLLGVAALAMSGLNPLSLGTMSSLLLLSFAFKTLETTHRRDALVIVFTGYFLVAVQFLFSQSIAAAMYGVVCLTLLTAALVAVQESPNKKVSDHVKLAGLMLLQCLPLMIIIYLFFPRLPPLWAVSLPSDQAKSGISDHMAPGDIARLAQSDSTAFHVTFKGARPSQNKLYWRGLVLSAFDGRTWSQFPEKTWFGGHENVSQQNLPNLPTVSPGQSVLEYDILFEQTGQSWLFSLPTVVSWKGDALRGLDYRLISRQALNSPTELTVFSDIDSPRNAPLNQALRKLNLSIPPDQNPRARARAKQWRAEAGTDKAYAQYIMAYFRDQNFFYTLRPPLTGASNTIDRFLFETRRGFCSHYAGSFVYLMREAGIPARVVAGYQGGEWNESGNFLTVREYDAHAWAEIWIEGEGWIRFDPTFMVAPERIEQNLQTAVEGEGSFLEESVFSPARIRWLTTLRQKWDAVQYGWRQWVLGYDTETQSRWLKSWIGKVNMLRVALVFGGLFALILLSWLVMMGYFRRTEVVSPSLKLYRKLCRKLGKQGLTRPPDATPGQFALMAENKLPDQSTGIREATRLYEMLSYSNPSAEQEASLLARLKVAISKI